VKHARSLGAEEAAEVEDDAAARRESQREILRTAVECKRLGVGLAVTPRKAMIIMVVMAIGCYLPGILPSDSCHHLLSKYYDVFWHCGPRLRVFR
jgi:hypothetical protein